MKQLRFIETAEGKEGSDLSNEAIWVHRDSAGGSPKEMQLETCDSLGTLVGVWLCGLSDWAIVLICVCWKSGPSDLRDMSDHTDLSEVADLFE